MSANAPAARGLGESLRAIGATLSDIVQVRATLFGVELREEIERRKHMLALAALGAAFLHMALVLASVLIAAIFWDTHRLAALATLTALYAACGWLAVVRLRHAAAAGPAPFAGTLGELERDLADLGAPR